MRWMAPVAVTVSGLLMLTSSGAKAQAPTPPEPAMPKFLITGFIDQLITYSNNTSTNEGPPDLHRKDYQFYGRTRGRFDIVGEYGTAKAVLGLETDLVYGQTGIGNTNVSTVQGGATTAATGAVNVFPGTDGSFSLNTDVRGQLELKWLYTEFE